MALSQENELFVTEWNKKSSTLSEVMKRCGIDLRTAKTKARTLKKYLTCTREDKLSARGVSLGEAPAAETKVASKKALTKEETAEKKAAEKGKKIIMEFRDQRGDIVETKTIYVTSAAQIHDAAKEFGKSKTFDKTEEVDTNGSRINPDALNDGDTVVIRPVVSGARH